MKNEDHSPPQKKYLKPPKQLCYIHLKSVGLIPFIRFPLPFISFIMFSPHQDLTKNPSKIHDFVGGFGFQLDAQTNSTSATRTNGRWSHGRCFLAETDVGQLWEGCFWNLKRRVCLTYSENTVDNDGHFCIHMYILYDSIMLKSIIILFAQSSRSPSRPPRQNNHIVDHDLASSNGPQAWEQVDIKLIIALVKGFFLFTFFSPVNSQNPPGEKTRTSSVAGR